MYSKLNFSTRMNLQTFELDHQGSFFINEFLPNGKDFSDFSVIHTGLDTIKQKYKGHLNNDVVNNWLDHLETNHKINVTFLDSTFHLSKAPRASGFRYMLKSNSMGIHVFFGSFHKLNWLDDGNGICKVEFSPQIIHEHGLENIYYISQSIGNFLFYDYVFNGVEAHICADVQGWKPEQDFLENVTTLSRVKKAFNGLTGVYTDLSTIAVRYDKSESFLIGKSGSSQLAIYNKTLEIQTTGKKSWWEDVYSNNPVYDPSKEVYRIELRLHDSVIKNLGEPEDSIRYEIEDIFGLIDHIPSLWRYGLYKLFRYHYSNSDLIRPEWQFLADSITFNIYTDNEYFYKRVEKEIMDDSIEFNIQQALGHLSSAFAKANIPDDQVIKSLKALPIYKRLNYYFEDKGMSESTWHLDFLLKLADKKVKFSYMQMNPFLNVKNYVDSRQYH